MNETSELANNCEDSNVMGGTFVTIRTVFKTIICRKSHLYPGMHWFNTITVLLIKNKAGSFYILSWE